MYLYIQPVNWIKSNPASMISLNNTLVITLYYSSYIESLLSLFQSFLLPCKTSLRIYSVLSFQMPLLFIGQSTVYIYRLQDYMRD